MTQLLPTQTKKCSTPGTFYYVGDNENFGNYKKKTGDFVTRPVTARLRIGLAHSAEEDKDARDDVDFDAYVLRVTDESGDVVPEGDDITTCESSYASTANRLVLEISDATALSAKFSNVRINDGSTIRALVQGVAHRRRPPLLLLLQLLLQLPCPCSDLRQVLWRTPFLPSLRMSIGTFRFDALTSDGDIHDHGVGRQ